jgi:Holliday junction DNA helicase RuvA
LAGGPRSAGGAPIRAVIAHLSGTLLDKQLQRLVVDVGGVGYDVQVPLSTYYAVGDVGAPVALRIHTHVREDALQLFGFATPLEQALFERLIAVSGIGPKVALAVLSGIEPESLVRAIRDADFARLTSIPGVGKKTAERLVVEMRDRLPKTAETPASGAPSAVDDLRSDVLSALANLGYQRAAAERGLERVLTTSDSREFEDVLRAILKDLAR